ncbi:FG-GAP repeat domain-containing protein [Sorangium sp. So ce1151]|uniref:FG-GAP repeat domain-containing protein n=1 Tax=Sorangium sp. So ce1151 TaxID=3133332 RepID=UPI003F62535A
MKRTHGLSLALALALAGCANLSLLEEDVCGNRVVEEPDEACDGQEGCGAPGSAHQCRYLCGAYGLACPDGHGCGADGVCRRPSGAFEELATRGTVNAMELSTGDINADGCDELVHTTLQGTTITAFPSQAPGLCAQAEQALRISRATSEEETSPAPLLRDMTGDGQLDLVVPGRGDVVAAQGGDAANGLFVYSAPESITIAPTLYSTTRLDSEAARLLSVRLRGRDAALIFLGAAAAAGDAGSDGGIACEPPSGGPGRVAVMSDPGKMPQTLAGEVVDPGEIAAVVAADIVEGAAGSDACDEAIVARRCDDRIRIHAVCGPGGSFELLALPEVQLGGGARIRNINASLAMHDQNGDGQLDLIVNAIRGDLGEIHVAYGVGGGRFHSTPTAPADGVADQRTGVLSLGNASLEGALADPYAIFVAGDFNASLPGPELVPLECPSGTTLFQSPVCSPIAGGCEAVGADVNADGHLDIVATTAQLPDLAIQTGASDGTFYPQRIATRCPPHYLVVADVDGDRVNDIAYFDQQARPSSPQPWTLLDIAYGNAFSAPSPPAGHGRLDLAAGLVAGRVIERTTGAQLLAVRGLPRAMDRASGSGLALIEGGSERLIRAPFYFPVPGNMPPGGGGNMPPDGPPGGGAPSSILPVRLRGVAGGVLAVEDDGTPVHFLAAVTEHIASGPAPAPEGAQLSQLWLITVSPEGDNLAAAASGRPEEGEPPCEACVLAPIDTDGDGRDELVWIDDGELAVYGADGGPLVERSRQKTAYRFKAVVERAAVTEHASPPKYAPRPLVADLDGDGQKDLLARADTGKIIAFWGRAGGGFDEAELAAPDPPCDGDAACVGLAVALLNADADAALEVAVAGPGRLELYDLDAGARQLRPLGAPFPGPPPDATSDFVALGAADFDGDGVDDLAVAMSSAFLKVFRGAPVLQ